MTGVIQDEVLDPLDSFKTFNEFFYVSKLRAFVIETRY